MIEAEGEAFIRKNLGLPPLEPKAALSEKKIEACEVDTKSAELVIAPDKKP